MNKFEQVFSVHHQMSLAGELAWACVEGLVGMPRLRGVDMSGEGGSPYHVKYPIMHVPYPSLPEQTNACENITILCSFREVNSKNNGVSAPIWESWIRHDDRYSNTPTTFLNLVVSP